MCETLWKVHKFYSSWNQAVIKINYSRSPLVEYITTSPSLSDHVRHQNWYDWLRLAGRTSGKRFLLLLQAQLLPMWVVAYRTKQWTLKTLIFRTDPNVFIMSPIKKRNKFAPDPRLRKLPIEIVRSLFSFIWRYPCVADVDRLRGVLYFYIGELAVNRWQYTLSPVECVLCWTYCNYQRQDILYPKQKCPCICGEKGSQ